MTEYQPPNSGLQPGGARSEVSSEVECGPGARPPYPVVEILPRLLLEQPARFLTVGGLGRISANKADAEIGVVVHGGRVSE